jgi:hypothetical protein
MSFLLKSCLPSARLRAGGDFLSNVEEDKLDPDDAIVTFRREEHMLLEQQLLAIASVVPIILVLLIAIRL